MAVETVVAAFQQPQAVRAGHRRHIIIAVIAVATAINYLDRANLAIVAPDIKSDLHISAGTMGLVFAAFGWTYALFQIPGGVVLEKLGPRLAFGYALVLWSIATAAQGLSLI